MSWPSSRPASPNPNPNPVGLWFCQISSGLQGRWQQAVAGGASDPQGARNNGARGADTRQATTTTVPEPNAAGTKDKDVPVLVPPRKTAAPTTTCRREAMPEATVYLLLDRFAPS